ncbi:PTS transporter subunit EIIC [Streptomyces sp. CB01881]|uniref:PTS transporter subunit EIIC n=1 Tax=Streptomyces sp. CB01881 TaxID=2078691 RepID=UPI000CDC1547|nr:PTS transporter subunit EIIC [Streptomyces sp. CB01881]AUY51603.1 PTS lactose transporter subunit IIC [Streptomyces sp. CB01881]TYC74993.1 PTS lactose transporter subunit IIC [Streptomyces sp. CB01881]
MSQSAQAPAPAAAPATPSPTKKFGQNLLQGLQKIGRSLQLPIAVLPAAGLLLRLGQDDVFGKDGLGWNKVAAVFATAGDAVFANLPLLFAVGIAIGFAKKADGSTALAALVGFLVYKNVLTAFPVTEAAVVDGKYTAATYQNPGVLGGIVIGLLSAVLWQKYHRTRLVDWLGFFNGRRLVPIIMAFVGTAVGVVFALAWGPVGDAIKSLNDTLIGAGAFGAGAFGLVNRGLLPVGMHQFVNSYAWFQTGDFTKPDGTVVHGDLTRFFAGDPTAGQFMSGFFPIMMFALPAAAFAIAHTAKPHRRKAVTGMMLSLALTSFVTGVTEPIEFAFVFIAPALYVIHAVLTAVSMALTWALGVHDGFTFSGGLIDYALAWNKATDPWMIIPIGIAFAALYYFLFRFAIVKFDLKTPGREDDDEIEDVTKA